MKTPLQKLAEDTFKLSSIQELREAGYRRYKAGDLKPGAEELFQKKIRPGLYLNIYTYDLNWPGHPDPGLKFQPEAQLRSESRTINVSLLLDVETLEDIEHYFVDMADWFESKYGPLEN